MSVTFLRLDNTRIESVLQRYVKSLVGDPRVLAVVLFGSLARGDATAASDADVVIILSDWPAPFHDRVPDFLRPGIGLAMDVFPYTLQEALSGLQGRQGIVPVALREGRWLVDRAGVRDRLLHAFGSGGGC